MKGLEGKINNLGRIVIPIEYRRALGLTECTRLLLSMDAGSIVMTPIEQSCIICQGKNNLNSK